MVTGAILAPLTCGASLAVTAVGAGLGAAAVGMGIAGEHWKDEIKEANKKAEKELKSPEVMQLTQQLHVMILCMLFVGYTQEIGDTFAKSEDGKGFFSAVEEGVKLAKEEEHKDKENEGFEDLKERIDKMTEVIEAFSKTTKAVTLSVKTIKFYKMYKEAGEITEEMKDLLKEAVLPEVTPTSLAKTFALELPTELGEAAGELSDLGEAGEAILELGKTGNGIMELQETICDLGEAAEAGEAAEEAGTAIAEAGSAASAAIGVVGGAVDMVVGGIDLAKGIDELKSDGGKVAEACRHSADGLDHTVDKVEGLWPKPKSS